MLIAGRSGILYPPMLPPSEGPPSNPTRTAVFTVVSKNYLHYARTLHQSLAQTNPDWEKSWAIADSERSRPQPHIIMPTMSM